MAQDAGGASARPASLKSPLPLFFHSSVLTLRVILMSVHDMPPEGPESRGFQRDTIVFAMGSLSAVLMSSALSDAMVIERYESWMRRQAGSEWDGRLEALVRASMPNLRDG